MSASAILARNKLTLAAVTTNALVVKTRKQVLENWCCSNVYNHEMAYLTLFTKVTRITDLFVKNLKNGFLLPLLQVKKLRRLPSQAMTELTASPAGYEINQLNDIVKKIYVLSMSAFLSLLRLVQSQMMSQGCPLNPGFTVDI